MNYFTILADIARRQFLINVLKYRLSAFSYDFILDYKSHAIIVLDFMPGVLIMRLETTKNEITHYECSLLSEGTKEFLGCFYLNETFPIGKPDLRLVHNNEDAV